MPHQLKVSGKLGTGALLAGLALASAAPSCDSKKDSIVVVAVTAVPAEMMLDSLLLEVDAVQKTFPLTPDGLGAIGRPFGIFMPGSASGTKLVVGTAHIVGQKACYIGTAMVKLADAGGRADVPLVLKPSVDCKISGGSGGSGGSTGTGGGGVSEGGSTGTGGATATGGSGGGVATGGTTGTGGAGGTAGTTPTGGVGGTAGMPPTGGTGGTAGAGGTAARDGGMDASMDAPPTIVNPPSLTKCTEYIHSVITACDTTTGDGDWSIWSLAFSRDGKLLLTAGEDSRIKVWNVATDGALTPAGRVLATDGQGYIAFSPDGTMLVGGSHNGTLTLWNTATWTVRQNLVGLTGSVYGVGFSPDSKQVIALDSDGNMTVHSVDSPTAQRSFTLPSSGWALGVSPVRTTTEFWIAMGYDTGAGELLNLSMMPATGTLITIDTTGSEAISFNNLGKVVATGGDDGVVKFWAVPPAATASPVAPNITALSPQGDAQAINGLQFSPDGRHIGVATGGLDSGGRLGIWDATTRQARGAFVPTWIPLSFAWHPGGAIVAGGEYRCGKLVVCAD